VSVFFIGRSSFFCIFTELEPRTAFQTKLIQLWFQRVTYLKYILYIFTHISNQKYAVISWSFLAPISRPKTLASATINNAGRGRLKLLSLKLAWGLTRDTPVNFMFWWKSDDIYKKWQKKIMTSLWTLSKIKGIYYKFKICRSGKISWGHTRIRNRLDSSSLSCNTDNTFYLKLGFMSCATHMYTRTLLELNSHM